MFVNCTPDQHHNHNNNTNERSRGLNEDDLLYHRKDELERRPRIVTEPREQNRFDERDNSSPSMHGDYRPPRFNNFAQPQSYRGRSRPFSFPHSRGTMFRPPTRPYNPQRAPRPRVLDSGPRTRSLSRSRSKSRSSSRSSSRSRSRSSSPSLSPSRSSSRAQSPRHDAVMPEAQSPVKSALGPSEDKPRNERKVTRRAQSLEPPALRRWNSVNLSGARDSEAVEDRGATPSPRPEHGEAAASHPAHAPPQPELEHAAQSEDRHALDEERVRLQESERRLRAEEQRSARLEQRLATEQQRAAEERTRHGEEERVRHEELQRISGEHERLQRECDKLRAERDASLLERDQLRAEHERVKSEHEAQRTRAHEEAVEHERQLRVTAERALEDERARHRESLQVESTLRAQLEALRSEQSGAAHVPGLVNGPASESAVAAEAESDADKTHKRKAAQQLGTKPKRRKTESEGKKARESEKHAAASQSVAAVPHTTASLVLDLTDE